MLPGITAKFPRWISRCITLVAMILRSWMWVHPSNSCRYCHKPYSVTCWVDLAPNHQWIDVFDDWVDKLPRLTRFHLHQHPHRMLNLDANVRPRLYFLNEWVWSCRNPFFCFKTQTTEHRREYRGPTCSYVRRQTFGSILLGTMWHSLPLEYLLNTSHRIQRRLGTWWSCVFANSCTNHWGAHTWINCDSQQPCECGGYYCLETHSAEGHSLAAAETAKPALVTLSVIEPPTSTPSELDAYKWNCWTCLSCFNITIEWTWQGGVGDSR